MKQLWNENLEHELSIEDAANSCKIWDSSKIYYVYIYRDILQLQIPTIYVGIGHGNRRARSHWTQTHNQGLTEYIKYWKKNGVQNVTDVMSIVANNLTQRQAAAVECSLIRKHEADVVNVVDYWTPAKTAPASERQQRHFSTTRMGQKRDENANLASSRSLSNQLTLQLYKDGTPVKTFVATSATSIANWIQRNHVVEVNTSLLWKTLRTGHPTNGFSLLILEGKLKNVSALQKVKKRIAWVPVLLKGLDGICRVFISISSAAEAIGSTSSKLSLALSGKSKQTGSHNIRYLTEKEIKNNIHLWPLYYKVTVDDHEELVLNLNAATQKFKIKRSAFSNFLKDKVTYPNRNFTVSYNKKIACEMYFQNQNEEIFGFEVKDNLKTPMKTLYYHRSGNRFSIVLPTGDVGSLKQAKCGTTVSEEIAQKVVNYFFSLPKTRDTHDKAKAYLAKLKKLSGEKTRVPDYFWDRSKLELVLTEINPSSLSNWEAKSLSSYSAACKMGLQRELFTAHCMAMGRKPNMDGRKQRTDQDVIKILLKHQPKSLGYWRRFSESSYQWAKREEKIDTIFNQYLQIKKAKKVSQER